MGKVAIFLAFHVENISNNVLVAINKIGSLINGPVLGVFILGLLTKNIGGSSARIGLVLGFLINLYCWKYHNNISWLWWNVIGFLITIITAFICNITFKTKHDYKNTWSIEFVRQEGLNIKWVKRYIYLSLWFLFILSIIIFLKN